MNTLYSTKEAAAYLGIAVSTMKKYVHVEKRIQGHKVGHSLVFTQDELDEFDASRRKVGRPRKNSVE